MKFVIKGETTDVWTIKLINWATRRCMAREVAQKGDQTIDIEDVVYCNNHDEVMEWLRWMEDEAIEEGYEYRCKYNQFLKGVPVKEKTFMIPYDHLTAIYHGWGEA